jgi:hypothetical protein
VPLPSLGRRNGVGAPFPNPAAKQGEPGVGALVAAELKHLGFEPIGALQAPGGDCDAAREQGLQGPDRRQLLEERRLQRGQLGGVLLRQHEVLLRAQAMLQRILRGARLAFFGLRAARFGAVASARLGTRIG